MPFEVKIVVAKQTINLRKESLPWKRIIHENIERYRHREASVEEALIEMYLAGASVRRVEDITEALWGTKVSSEKISNLNKKVYEKIETWRNRHIEEACPYVYLDGIVLKRSWAGEVTNVSVLVAIGVSEGAIARFSACARVRKKIKQGLVEFSSAPQGAGTERSPVVHH